MIKFDNIDKILGDGIKVFASERLANKHLKKQIPFNKHKQINLLVGPEGGLSDYEVNQLERLGFKAHSLGPRLLKSETAAIVLAGRLFT